jgi:hypothetical protein
MFIALEEVKTIGSGLLRPEGVMALGDGSLYAADGKSEKGTVLFKVKGSVEKTEVSL